MEINKQERIKGGMYDIIFDLCFEDIPECEYGLTIDSAIIANKAVEDIISYFKHENVDIREIETKPGL